MPISSIVLICVNYGSEADILRMMRSVVAPQGAKAPGLFFAIVDNSDSLDDSAEGVEIRRFGNAEILSPKANLGYFGGAEYGRRNSAQIDQDSIVAIVNPDIEFDADFFDVLLDCAQTSSEKTGVLAPNVINMPSGLPGNPFLSARPGLRYFQTRRIVNKNALFSSVWVLLYRLKRLVRPPQPAIGQGPEAALNIYAGHGSLLVFLPTYFRHGNTFALPSFLYSEELFVSEFCVKSGLSILLVPNLRARHHEHVATGLLPSASKRRFKYESLSEVEKLYRLNSRPGASM